MEQSHYSSKNPPTQSVHKVLAASYLTYFLLCSLGLFLGIFFPLHFSMLYATFFAVLCFGVGPFLMLWAQYTSHRFEILKRETGQIQFKKGPYRFLRNPTQLGLVILVLGYALVTGTAILFVTTGVAYIISNVFFKKHEEIMESRYGTHYSSYKASVKKVL
jgi:protein-S-isoprenylcysteine O-methyltransferase Ste14